MTILNERKEREEKEQSEQKEQREQESRPPESELVVESGNEIKNEVLETVHEGENRVESPVHLVDSQDSTKMLEINQNRLSSSSRSGSDVDCRRKTERTPSPSGSDDDYEQKAGSKSSQKSDEYSAKLRKEAAMDKMSVSLPRLDEVPEQIKEMRRYWINSKPGPLSSKPGVSKAIVEPSTSKAFKALRFEVHDLDLLFGPT
jgi:hypothetical protein